MKMVHGLSSIQFSEMARWHMKLCRAVVSKLSETEDLRRHRLLFGMYCSLLFEDFTHCCLHENLLPKLSLYNNQVTFSQFNSHKTNTHGQLQVLIIRNSSNRRSYVCHAPEQESHFLSNFQLSVKCNPGLHD